MINTSNMLCSNAKQSRYKHQEEPAVKDPKLYMKSLEESETIKIFKQGIANALKTSNAPST